MTRESSAAEKYPDPIEELESQDAKNTDRSAEKSTNNNPEKSERLARDTDQYAAILSSEKGKATLDRIEKWAENPDAGQGIAKSLSYLDNCSAMRNFREWWANRDRLTQWAIMYGTTHPTLLIQNCGVIQTLIKFGFITYKGHGADPKKMEDEIDRMGGMSDYLLKYGVKIGKYFIPELKAMEPFIEPLLQVKGIETKGLRKIRHQVYVLRGRYEKEQLTPEDVKGATHMDAIDTVEHEPANDNAAAEVIRLPKRALKAAKPGMRKPPTTKAA